MKSLDRFIEEAAKSVAPKSCPPGQYYCFTDRKCKKIPNGYRVGYGGMLRPEKKNGGKNGNGRVRATPTTDSSTVFKLTKTLTRV